MMFYRHRQDGKAMEQRIMLLEQICDDLIAVLEACMPLLSVLTDISQEARDAILSLYEVNQARQMLKVEVVNPKTKGARCTGYYTPFLGKKKTPEGETNPEAEGAKS